MRASFLTFLWVMGGAMVVGCGGGGGTTTGAAPGPIDDSAYQKPTSSYQPAPSNSAPSDYQAPPSTYQTPGMSTSTSSGGALCDALCKDATLLTCASDSGDGNTAELTPDQCASACAQQIQSVPCASQLVDAFDCLFPKIDITCDSFQNLANGDVDGIDPASISACQGVVDALAACQQPATGDNGNGNGNGNTGRCNPPDDCGGCIGACAACGCANFDDQSVCDTACGR